MRRPRPANRRPTWFDCHCTSQCSWLQQLVRLKGLETTDTHFVQLSRYQGFSTMRWKNRVHTAYFSCSITTQSPVFSPSTDRLRHVIIEATACHLDLLASILVLSCFSWSYGPIHRDSPHNAPFHTTATRSAPAPRILDPLPNLLLRHVELDIQTRVGVSVNVITQTYQQTVRAFS